MGEKLKKLKNPQVFLDLQEKRGERANHCPPATPAPTGETSKDRELRVTRAGVSRDSCTANDDLLEAQCGQAS